MMARKPPVSYAAVELEPIEEPATRQSAAEPEAAPAPERHGRRPTLKEAAAPVMLYLDPAALKALKRYALDQNTKVHSFWTPWKHGSRATACAGRSGFRRREKGRE